MFKIITKSITVATALSLGAIGIANAGPSDSQGPSLPSVAPTSSGALGGGTLWAYILADGTHTPGTSGLGLFTSQKISTGRYEVTFRRPINNNCAYVPVVSAQRAGTFGNGRFITAVQRAGNTRGLYIETRDAAGADADSEFMVMVSCYR